MEVVVAEKVTLAMERKAALMARQKADSRRWDLNVATWLVAVVVVVFVLSVQGVSFEVVTLAAVIGLAAAWLVGGYNSRAAYPGLFAEELAGLIRESLVAKTFRRSRDRLVDDAVQKALRVRRQ